jgi:hypothetical protein
VRLFNAQLRAQFGEDFLDFSEALYDEAGAAMHPDLRCDGTHLSAAYVPLLSAAIARRLNTSATDSSTVATVTAAR